MKKISQIICILSILLIVNSCEFTNKSNKQEIIIKKSDIIRKQIGVSGMNCVGCEVTLEENISKIKGVTKVKASHKNKEAIIEFDSTKTDIIKISNEIRKAGYKPFIK